MSLLSLSLNLLQIFLSVFYIQNLAICMTISYCMVTEFLWYDAGTCVSKSSVLSSNCNWDDDLLICPSCEQFRFEFFEKPRKVVVETRRLM